MENNNIPENLDKIRIRYKKCVTCSLINPEADLINDCRNDPSCPGGKIQVEIGVDPEIVKREIKDRILQASTGALTDFIEYLVQLNGQKYFKNEWFSESLASLLCISDINNNKNDEDEFDESEIIQK